MPYEDENHEKYVQAEYIDVALQIPNVNLSLVLTLRP
jgi:hypothetical protein